jgi:hypothetical protein
MDIKQGDKMKTEATTTKVLTAEEAVTAQFKDVLINDTKTKTSFIMYVNDLKKHNINTKTLSNRYSDIKKFIKAQNADDNHKKLVNRTVSLAYDYISFELVAKFDELHFSTIEQAVKVAKMMMTTSKGEDKNGVIGSVMLKRIMEDKSITLVTYENAIKELKKEIANVYNRPEFKGVKFTTQTKTDYNNAVSKVIHTVSHAYKIIIDENGVAIKLSDIKSNILSATLSDDEIMEIIQLLNTKKADNLLSKSA